MSDDIDYDDGDDDRDSCYQGALREWRGEAPAVLADFLTGHGGFPAPGGEDVRTYRLFARWLGMEIEGDENWCVRCAADTDDGEGWDGYCGDCADLREAEEDPDE